MSKLLTRVAASAVLLCVFFMESPAPARGQGVGVYRGRQGRKVGRVTLPTPPFNPDAGILNSGGGRDSAKKKPRRSTGRGVKAVDKNHTRRTPVRRRVRRHQPSR